MQNSRKEIKKRKSSRNIFHIWFWSCSRAMGWMDERCCWACQKSLHRISENESLSVCRWIGVSAHICVCFEPLCRAAFLQAQSETVCAFVTVQPSPGATAGLWQQPLQISHSCVTNSWPRNSRAASYLQTHSHTRAHPHPHTYTHHQQQTFHDAHLWAIQALLNEITTQYVPVRPLLALYQFILHLQ